MCECVFKTVCVRVCFRAYRHMDASMWVWVCIHLCVNVRLYKYGHEFGVSDSMSVRACWRMQRGGIGKGQRERHSSKTADPFTLLPSQDVRTKQAGDSDPQALPRLQNLLPREHWTLTDRNLCQPRSLTGPSCPGSAGAILPPFVLFCVLSASGISWSPPLPFT